MDTFCIYLRKSRADADAESRGDGETLARHRRTLMDLAVRLELPVSEVYEEIVSGDTIASRPQMQRLLADVEAGRWSGVLCMEIERLARGDSIDQGIVAQAFKYSHTLIITPVKTYNPDSEIDEEYFEFGLFMARREFKTIKRRLQAGRLASAKEGNYLGTRMPFGYVRAYTADGSPTLAPDPVKAPLVRQIYEWYASQDIGAGIIAHRLNDMGVRTDLGCAFTASGIRGILRNPIYVGRVTWNKRTKSVRMVDGVRTTVRVPSGSAVDVPGHHPPIVPQELWDQVQAIFSTHAKRPKNEMAAIANPLAGLVRCARCGRTLQAKPMHGTAGTLILFCPTVGCATYGCRCDVVEQAILSTLDGWLYLYDKPATSPHSAPPDPSAPLRAQLAQFQQQLDRLHDLLEQGVYDADTFLRRRADLTARMDRLRAGISELSAARPDPATSIRAVLPAVRAVRAAYSLSSDPADRNRLLRTCIHHITYTKDQRCYRNNPADHLSLDVFPLQQ